MSTVSYTSLIGNGALTATVTYDPAADTYWIVNLIRGGAGGDTLTALQNPVVIGGATYDISSWLYGGAGADTLSGGSGDDSLFGEGGADTLNGGLGNDTLHGSFGDADIINGGGGDDVIYFNGVSGGSINGGAGTDVLHGYSASLAATAMSNVEVLMTDGYNVTATAAQFQSFTTIMHSLGYPTWQSALTLAAPGVVDLTSQLDHRGVYFNGSAGADTITSGAGGDALYGNAGADTLNGGAGDDTLNGGGGDDTLNGGADNDILQGGAGDADTLNGGAGNDALYSNGMIGGAIDGGADADAIYATGDISSTTITNVETLMTGSGVVTATAAQLAGFTTIMVSPAQSTAQVGLTLASAGTVDLTSQLAGRSAYIWGSAGADVITASNGADVLYGGPGADILNGGAGADTLYGYTGEADVLNGDDGNDVLYANGMIGGAVDGGVGTDSLYAIGNISATAITRTENLYTSGFNVIATAAQFAGFTTIARSGSEPAGQVTLTLASAGAVNLSGQLLGRGVDFTGSGGNDTITTSNGNDFIHGNGGNDTLSGGAGNDYIEAGRGNDILNGGDGHDTLNNYYGGADVMNGGAGNDTFQWYYATGTSIDGGADNDGLYASGDISVASIVNVETLYAQGVTATAAQFQSFGMIAHGSGDLTAQVSLTLASAGVVNLTNQLFGRAVVFNGSSGDDTIISSGGADTLNGADGADRLSGWVGNDALAGGLGHDSLSGGAGDDALDGGAGLDTATYADAAAEVSVDLRIAAAQDTGGAGVDTLISIENLSGSLHNDTLRGDANANAIFGNSGNDVIFGHGGNDTLRGGVGDDALDGGDGSDTATYADAAAAITIDLRIVAAQNTGGAGIDTLISIENLSGSIYNDTLRGNAGANGLFGNAGSDAIFGYGGNDSLRGGAGDDALDGGDGFDAAAYTDAAAAVTVDLRVTAAQNTGGAGTDTLISIENLSGSIYNDTLRGNAGANVIYGNDGADVIFGYGGRDTLNGGAGADRFSYQSVADSTVAASDAIMDFTAGDLIDLSLIDANTTNAAGTNDAFSANIVAAFTHVAGQLAFTSSGGVGTLSGDVNGDGSADFAIRLAGVTTLAAAGIVL